MNGPLGTFRGTPSTADQLEGTGWEVLCPVRPVPAKGQELEGEVWLCPWAGEKLEACRVV